MFNRRKLIQACAAATTAGLTPLVRGQQPPGTVKIIVVVPAGASMDNVARLVADKLKDRLKRNVIVEYRPGGTGLVAAQFLKSTEPDGSYLLFAPIAVAAFFPFLYSKLPYDADRDLVPVCDGVQIPHALTVPVAAQVETLQQYLAAAKADPLKASIGTSSMGSVGAMLILRLRQITGIDLQLVAYKGGQPLLTDLMGNQVPAGVSVISDYLAQHRAGKVRIIATGSRRRSELAPEVPTFVESGYPDLYGASSIGFFVRGGTATSLVQTYSDEINAVLRMAEVRTRLLQMGAEPTGGTPEEFRKLALSERARWEPVARAAQVRID